MKPLVVIDFRVCVYHILYQYEQIAVCRDQETAKKWLRAAWAIVLNRGLTNLPYFSHSIAVVDDSPPYWRSKYLSDRGFPLYKGGRKEKTLGWYEVYNAGLSYLNSANCPFHYLSYEGFEADDIAAAIVRTQPTRTVFLHTIDTDWLGLVSEHEDIRNLENLTLSPQDKFTCLWNNLDRWTPRLRGNQECIDYTQKRLKSVISSAREIWDVKSKKGDQADSLIKGSPLSVIDLLDPPPEHDLLTTEAKEEITEVAYSEDSLSRLDHLQKASEWLNNEGFMIPMYGFSDFPINFRLELAPTEG